MKTYPFFFLAAVAIAGCDHTQAAVGDPGTPPIKLAGLWTYTDTITTNDETASCKSTVNSLKLNQTYDTFSSTFTPGAQKCTNVEENDGNTWGPVTGGELYGDFVRFLFLGCTHTGTISGDPPTRMFGIVSCSFPVVLGGYAVDWNGTWEATRQ
jgi:hypothetical protein